MPTLRYFRLLVLGAGCAAQARQSEPTLQKTPVVTTTACDSAEVKVDRDVERLKEIATLDQENEKKKVALTQLETTVEKLQHKLQSALHGGSPGGLSSSTVGTDVMSGTRVKVQLASELLFNPGSARITREGRQALLQIAGVLQKNPSHRIEVAGHTDSSPIHKKYSDNWQLSTERARRVLIYLQSQGVDSKHMVAAGYGETSPVAGENSEEERRKNRRVDIFVEPLAEAPGVSSSE